MKIRNFFVSNSSSSSFILGVKSNCSDKRKEEIKAIVDIIGDNDCMCDHILNLIDDHFELDEEFDDESDILKCKEVFIPKIREKVKHNCNNILCDNKVDNIKTKVETLNPVWRISLPFQDMENNDGTLNEIANCISTQLQNKYRKIYDINIHTIKDIHGYSMEVSVQVDMKE